MGFFYKILGEFIDVIEWVDTTQDTLVWKFPRYNNEIKMGAKLTVRETQVAIFMNEGVVADIFTPGMYELHTQNMPLMTTLKSWKFGFNSPFKADVYFVSMRQFINQKWGTKNPVMLRDAEFGPIRLRAFGSYSFRVKDPGLFIKEIAATNPDFTVELINEQLRNIIVSRGMDAIAEAKIPALDLAANYNEVGALLTNAIQPDFAEIGLTLIKTLVENISVPPEVEEALDKRSSMGILGNLGAFAQYQAAVSMEKSAENPGGGNLGAAGMGIGMGAAMAGQMGSVFKQTDFDSRNPSGQQAPPPLPSAEYHVAIDGKSDGPRTLDQLSKLADSGVINKDTLVWKKGMAGWAAASTVAELKDIFDNEPPPLPLA